MLTFHATYYVVRFISSLAISTFLSVVVMSGYVVIAAFMSLVEIPILLRRTDDAFARAVNIKNVDVNFDFRDQSSFSIPVATLVRNFSIQMVVSCIDKLVDNFVYAGFQYCLHHHASCQLSGQSK
jgi:hypothetical protein